MFDILYFSAAGGAHSRWLFPGIRSRFAKASLKLVVYDDTDFSEHQGAEIIRQPGFKWPLAKEHLHPDVVARYDYLFVWDDDIDVGTFDLERFVVLMDFNGLSMAQPSIRSPHWISHPIVKQVAGGVGRFTNFVEVMVPVFSREGWRRFYPFLTDENTSGWGYDYAPIEPRGVIDEMFVTHTRPVSSCSARSRSQLDELHKRHGLEQYHTESFSQLKDPGL